MEPASTISSDTRPVTQAARQERYRPPTLDETVLDEGDFCSNPLEKDYQVVLNQVTRHYHRKILRTLPGQQFLRRLGLHAPNLIETYKIGYSDRSLCHLLGNSRSLAGGGVRGRLQRLGILRPSGHELFRGSIVVPILDYLDNTLDMWGHKVSFDQRSNTPVQISLFDPPRGVFNAKALKGQEEIILCGGLIDAMTVWCCGMKNVTATLGVRGLTVEHLDIFQRNGVKKVVIAFERTKLGDSEARLVAQALDAMRIDVARLDLPSGLDVNSYTRLRYPTKGPLKDMIRDAHPFRQTYINLREDMACPRAQNRTH